MIGWPKKYEMLPDITPNRILLDVQVSRTPKNKKMGEKRYIEFK